MHGYRFKLVKHGFRRHSGLDDETGARLQSLSDAAEKTLHVRVFKKTKTVPETICSVINRVAFYATHVAENKLWYGRPAREPQARCACHFVSTSRGRRRVWLC